MASKFAFSHSTLENKNEWHGVNWTSVSWTTPSPFPNDKALVHHTIHVCTASKEVAMGLARFTPEEQAELIQYIANRQDCDKPSTPFLVTMKPTGENPKRESKLLATVVWGEIIPGVEAIITLSPVS